MATEAPGQLELVRRFLNTWTYEGPVEKLPDPASLRDWLVEHDLMDASGTVDAGELDRARTLRDALRDQLRAHHGGAVDPAAAAIVDAAARRARLRAHFGADDAMHLVPEAGGVDGGLGRLLAIVGDAMRDGTWSRLKVCPADDCRYAFYDTSRNRSGVWCTMGVCGNRAKVRSFREREGAAARSRRTRPG
jgi:predicted RNA-binding Zn ribbon-like protein